MTEAPRQIGAEEPLRVRADARRGHVPDDRSVCVRRRPPGSTRLLPLKHLPGRSIRPGEDARYCRAKCSARNGVTQWNCSRSSASVPRSASAGGLRPPAPPLACRRPVRAQSGTSATALHTRPMPRLLRLSVSRAWSTDVAAPCVGRLPAEPPGAPPTCSRRHHTPGGVRGGAAPLRSRAPSFRYAPLFLQARCGHVDTTPGTRPRSPAPCQPSRPDSAPME